MAILTLFFLRQMCTGVRRRFGFWLVTLVMASMPPVKSWAQGEFNEYQLKAVFLFNFAQFVEWPESAFADAKSPLTIGIVGDDPFDGMLDDVVRGERVGQHEITVRRMRRIEDVDGCQILFISKSETSRIEGLIAFLGNRALLTVSDADRAARRGTMIRFVSEKKKIRLRVNLEAVQRAGLVMSSKLLRVAEIVSTTKEVP